MPEIWTALFVVVAIDALVVLGFGVTAAVLILMNKDADAFFSRIVPAAFVLGITSLAAAALVAGGNHWFLGG